MSNPLLNPDDRFRPRKIEELKDNPFQESDAVLEATQASEAARQQNTFAAGSADASRPYLPQYEMTAEHRGGLLLFLDAISLGGGLFGLLVLWLGYLLPLLALVPAVAALFLAADDLRTMKLGARNPQGRLITMFALFFAVLLIVSLSAMCGLFAYWRLKILPDWL